MRSIREPTKKRKRVHKSPSLEIHYFSFLLFQGPSKPAEKYFVGGGRREEGEGNERKKEKGTKGRGRRERKEGGEENEMKREKEMKERGASRRKKRERGKKDS